MNLFVDGENIVRNIKRASWFPYASGKVRDEATRGEMLDDNTYCITFFNYSIVFFIKIIYYCIY